MLKPYHFGATFLSIALSSNVLAIDCSPANKLNPSDLSDALKGNTVCVGAPGAWEAQEEHRIGGQLWDYKHGPSSSTNLNDPTAEIGSWEISGNTVIYTYAGSTSYAYNLHYDSISTTYTFCTTDGGTDTDAAKIVSTGSGCD